MEQKLSNFNVSHDVCDYMFLNFICVFFFVLAVYIKFSFIQVHRYVRAESDLGERGGKRGFFFGPIIFLDVFFLKCFINTY